MADKAKEIKVHVAMLGARLHYALPRLLHEARLLGTFFTDNYIGNKPWLERVLRNIPSTLRPRVLRRWLGRKEQALSPINVISFEGLGIRFWWNRRGTKNLQELAEVYAETAREFNELVIRAGLDGANVVWGFNGASLEMFRAAKARGQLCILEQTIAPRRVELQLLSEERDLLPGWQPTLVFDSVRDILAIREENEWHLADRIVCGSEFVIRGLAALDVELVKCRVVPYGIDLSRFQSRNNYRDRLHNRKLKVLFVGEVGLRKGAPYLLEALRKIGCKGVEARFAGEVVLNKKKLRRYVEESEFLGAVPRAEMEKLYQWADVLVLPSICEGFGIVHIEAFASGIPVVATPNSGTIVRDGIDGQIVPIRDSDAIAEVFERYISKPDYLQQHQQAARQGCEHSGLAAYREKVVSIIRELAN